MRDNIAPDELKAFRLLAGTLLVMDAAALKAAVVQGTLIEVKCDAEAIP